MRAGLPLPVPMAGAGIGPTARAGQQAAAGGAVMNRRFGSWRGHGTRRRGLRSARRWPPAGRAGFRRGWQTRAPPPARRARSPAADRLGVPTTSRRPWRDRASSASHGSASEDRRASGSCGSALLAPHEPAPGVAAQLLAAPIPLRRRNFQAGVGVAGSHADDRQVERPTVGPKTECRWPVGTPIHSTQSSCPRAARPARRCCRVPSPGALRQRPMLCIDQADCRRPRRPGATRLHVASQTARPGCLTRSAEAGGTTTSGVARLSPAWPPASAAGWAAGRVDPAHGGVIVRAMVSGIAQSSFCASRRHLAYV